MQIGFPTFAIVSFINMDKYGYTWVQFDSIFGLGRRKKELMMDAALFICSHYNVALYHIFGLSGKNIFFCEETHIPHQSRETL